MVKKFIFRVFCGFFLGLSVFAPGFSGSVIAIIMGVYHDLLRIISNPFKQFKQNFIYCLPLAIGGFLSAVFFVISFRFLFETYERATYILFVGLIAGNMPIILAEVKKYNIQRNHLVGGILAFMFAFAVCVLGGGIGGASGDNAVGLTIFAISGFIGGAVLLVPGMSISTILIIMGVYGPLIIAAESLVRMNFEYFTPIGIFAAFALIGLVSASRGIKFVFEKLPDFANTAVFGFMGGSLFGIFAQSLQIEDPHFNWIYGGVMFAIGLLASLLFVSMGKAMNEEKAK